MTPEQQQAYNEALKRIEACRSTRGTELDLNKIGLSHLPPQIGQLTALTGLFFHRNPALAIPESVLGPTVIETMGPDNKPLHVRKTSSTFTSRSARAQRRAPCAR